MDAKPSMNNNETLAKLLELKALVDQFRNEEPTNKNERRRVHDAMVQVYGEVALAFEQVVGKLSVRVPPGPSGGSVFPNYFEAGYLSGRTFYVSQAYNELLKVVGSVRARASAEAAEPDERSIGSVLQILQSLRECCQYVRTPPKDERDVQDIVWIMLRARFDRLQREETLPRFGAKQYRPDFGIPELRLLVEVKFIGGSSQTAAIQDEILADAPAYIGDHTAYTQMIVLIYDAAHKLRDARPIIDACKQVPGILEVIVVPGIGN
jgi:hypothetical protein